MLARRLTIWFLVFVTSGLLWLAVPRNGHSAETCTTLNCVSRGKRKVEKQIRQQEMMRSGGSKSRRARGSQSGKIRIRYISGESKKNQLKGKAGKEYNKINSLNIFYNSFGLGFTNYKNEGCRGNTNSGEYAFCDNNLTDKPYQRGEVNVISILYNFGNTLLLTIGGDLYASGYLIILDGDTGNEIEMRNPNPLHLLPQTFQLGFKLNKLEIIFVCEILY